MSDFDQQHNKSNIDSQPVETSLRQTIPQAEPAFRDNLEEQLMARLSKQDLSEETEMNVFNQDKQKRNTRSSRMPLTLVAAVLAIALVGGLFVFIQQSAPDMLRPADCSYSGTYSMYDAQDGDTLSNIATKFEVSREDIATANCLSETTIHYGQTLRIPVAIREASGQASNPRNVVVAADDLPRGSVITADMVTLESHTPDTIDAVFPFCCLDYVMGREVTEPVTSGTIIEERMLSDLVTVEEQKIPVVAARTNISEGDTIAEDQLQVIEYPISLVPGDTFMDTQFVIGQIARTNIVQMELINVAQLQSTDNANDDLAPLIGLVIGHAGEDADRGAVCEDGLAELDMNQSLAEATRETLQENGYRVDILGQFDAAISGYVGDLVMELHVIGCSDDSSSGYYTAFNEAASAPGLQACVEVEYEAMTGIPFADNISGDTPYVLNTVAETTPAILLTTGTLNADRDLLINEQDTVVNGVIATIECFLDGGRHDMALGDLSPLVIAKQDIPLNTLISRELVTTVYVTADVLQDLQPVESSFMNVAGSLELVVGQQSNRLIRQYEPVLMDSISSPQDCTSPLLGCLTLQNDVSILTLRTEDRTALSMPLGQYVDIVASMITTDVIGEGSIDSSPNVHPMIYTVADNIQLIGTSDIGDGVTVTLIVRQSDSEVLSYIQEANIPIRIVPHTGTDSSNSTFTIPDDVAPENTMNQDGTIFGIPLFTGDAHLDTLSEGETIDIYLSKLDNPDTTTVIEDAEFICISCDILSINNVPAQLLDNGRIGYDDLVFIRLRGEQLDTLYAFGTENTAFTFARDD